MLDDYNKTKKKRKEQREAIQFVKHKLDSAKWFIDAIKQRQQTLMLTMHAIMDIQNSYFLDGDEKLLRPMILNLQDRTIAPLDMPSPQKQGHAIFSKNGERLFTFDASFRAWNTAIGKQQGEAKRLSGPPTHVALNPDGSEFVVTTGDTAYVADGTGGLQILNVVDPSNITRIGTYVAGNAVAVQVVDSHGDGIGARAVEHGVGECPVPVAQENGSGIGPPAGHARKSPVSGELPSRIGP